MTRHDDGPAEGETFVVPTVDVAALIAERDSLLQRVHVQRETIDRYRKQEDARRRRVEKPAGPTPKFSELTIAAALSRGFFDTALCSLDNCQSTGFETDLYVVDQRMRVIDVEIKLSRADLKRDRDKAKWRYEWSTATRMNGRPTLQRIQSAEPALWPAGVWKHYVAIPEEVWHDKLYAHMSPASGLLLITDTTPDPRHWRVHTARKAKPNKAARPIGCEDLRKVARLQTFRLWESYKAAGWVGAEVARGE